MAPSKMLHNCKLSLTLSLIIASLKGDIDTAALMQKWSPVYRDELIAKYGTSKEELVEFFGKTRDELIAENTDAWIRLNRVGNTAQTKLIDLFNQFHHFIMFPDQFSSSAHSSNRMFLIDFLRMHIALPPSQFDEFYYYFLDLPVCAGLPR